MRNVAITCLVLLSSGILEAFNYYVYVAKTVKAYSNFTASVVVEELPVESLDVTCSLTMQSNPLYKQIHKLQSNKMLCLSIPVRFNYQNNIKVSFLP